MITLSQAIPQILQREWSFINTFTVCITVPPLLDAKCGWNASVGKDIELSVKDVSTSQLSPSLFQTWVNDVPIASVNEQFLQTFNITFKDYNQCILYRMFSLISNIQNKSYVDDAALTVTIYKDNDYISGSDERKLITYEKCIITGISQLSFSNETDGQIVEFSVDFTSLAPSVSL